MRYSRLLAFLMAVVLCLVSVSAALAKNTEEVPEEYEALVKKACKLLKAEGYKTDYKKDVKSFETWTEGDRICISIIAKNGREYGADFTKDGAVKYIINYQPYGGRHGQASDLDQKTVKKIEDKVKSFVKKNDPSLLKKIGKLEITEVWTEGDTLFVQVKDTKNKMHTVLQVKPSLRIWYFYDLK